MRALVETKQDGSVVLQLDHEAARAMFASVLFTSRYHAGIAQLARMAEEGLRYEPKQESTGN